MKKSDVIGAIILVVLLILFFGGFDIIRGVYGIALPDDNDMLILLNGGVFLIGLVWYIINRGINKRLAERIHNTHDPDEKIRLIDDAIKKNCSAPLEKTGKAREQACVAKVTFLGMAADAYISKEDFSSALSRLTEARALFQYLGSEQANSNTLSVSEQCILTESVCLSRLGRVGEAEWLITPFMNRLGEIDDPGAALIMTARFEQAISVNDVQTARKVVDYIHPIYERLEKNYGPEIRSDYFLMDGIVNLMEGLYDEGVQKLTYVINNTSDYGRLHRARKLLNYSYYEAAS